MASGFITLPNGQDWSARWSRYDLVLETIMNALAPVGDEGTLKKWIAYILPNEANGDIESGYCFFKKAGEGDSEDEFESILRVVDIRWMEPKFQLIFWNAVQELSLHVFSEPGLEFLIKELNACYKGSLKEEAVPPDDEDLKEIFLLNGFELAI